ncbi:Raptor N-terminal CASPase-like domain [Trinorchestia longiramus]|nr:Raptor N-terminal CASPase-like domain [Trinorchestia longiramus]
MKPPLYQSSFTAESEAAAMKEKNAEDPPRLYLLGPRHIDPLHHYEEELPPWRLKDRMKTVSVALVLCLNLNVDPPDIIKTNPCARLECWFDPLKCHLATKPIKQIGMKLQKQYETWQRRARYKQSHDPTIEELKQLCLSLRRNAKDERVLFHYNGHGVPRPTDNGEIWVFNSNYTQYIPLSVYELQQWLGCPSIYVYDCSNAGVLLKHFNNEGVWKSTQGSEEGDSGGEGESSTTAAEQHASSASQQRQQTADHLGGVQQQQYQATADGRGERQQQMPPGGGGGGGGRGGRASSRQSAADFGPVHPVNPNLVTGNPNFQANNVPGQENVNFNTNMGPNMGQPLESGCNSPLPSVLGESIHLCACGEGELLPMCPELPADVFTACLTTPITMAVRWFLLQHHCASTPPPLHVADKFVSILNAD